MFRTRARRVVASDVSLEKTIERGDGFTDAWFMQELTGSVALATNVAVALGRNVALLTYADYVAGAGWSNSGGQVALHTAGSVATLAQAGVLAIGKTYTITTVVTGRTAGSVILTGTGAVAISADGTATDNITALGTALTYTPTTDFDGSIDCATVAVKQTNIAASTAFPGAELLNEAGASGTATAANWTAQNNAALTNPSAGILRIARDGTNNPFGSQSLVTTVGKRYRVLGEVRSDGNATPSIQDGSVKVVFAGTTSTSWQSVNVEYVAGASSVFILSGTSTGTEYTEWRNVSWRTANPLNGDYAGGVTLGGVGGGGIPYMPEFDGATGYADIYSAELNSMFNPDAGTLIAFARSNTWAAGIDLIVRLGVDANNEVYLSRSGTDLILSYDAGGTAESVTIASGSPAGIFMPVLTWVTTGAGAVKAYYNGTQSGSTQTIAGTFVGNLASTLTVIGANATTPANVWDGGIAYVVLYNRALSASEILQIYQAARI